MDVRIIYFSQTGNTQKVARAMSDVFHQGDHHVQLIALQNATVEDAAGGDLIGVGTPCFSSKAPQPMMQFLDALPTLKKHKAFVFATCGGAPGKVLYDLSNSLRNKGVDVLAGHLTRGEVHHPAPSLVGRFLGRPNAEDLEQAQSFAKAISASLRDPFIRIPRNSDSSINHKKGFYEFLGSAISDPVIRAFLPEPKLNIINCDQCSICSQECPTQNIELKPYPVLGSDCIRCYHCYHICPGHAYSMNWQVGNPVIWLLYNQVFERWFGDIKPGERIY